MATKIELDKFSRNPKKIGANSRSAPSNVVKCVQVLASLKLTATLLAMSVFIVFVGTLVQVDQGIWEVVDTYFRIDFHKTSLFVSDFPFLNMDSVFAKVELKYFFPKSFFPVDPENPLAFPHNISGGFYFPKGWLIGLFLSINLLAAHGLRFRVQAKGLRMQLGLGVTALGILVTTLVILSGFDKDGVQDTPWLNWDAMWLVFKYGTVLVSVAALVQFVSLGMKSTEKNNAERPPEFWVLGAVTGVLMSASLYLLIGGDSARLNNSSMRILWQLMKGTIAGVVLLAGCWLLFRKRAGIVLIHSGVGLMMFSELFVGVTAEEANMTIIEGETAIYSQDTRSLELAIVDISNPSQDHMIVVPEHQITESGKYISDDSLPFDLEILKFHRNTSFRRLNPTENLKATKGFGLLIQVDDKKRVPATDTSNAVDNSAIFVQFTDKTDKKNKSLGIYLLPLFLPETAFFNDYVEVVEFDKKKYEISLRFKRIYKPYRITLYDVTKEDYKGTNTPRDYNSYIRLEDKSNNIDSEHRIWMNNPLRYSGETFYQSSYNKMGEDGPELTILQVVTNTGWMIPYVSCMLVATGMLAHFLISLMRFFNRQKKELIQKTDLLSESHWHRYIPYMAMCAAGILFVFTPMRMAVKNTSGFDVKSFGDLPVFYGGRAKPLDSLARNHIRVLTDNRQTYQSRKNEFHSASKFLLDLIAQQELADTHRVFKIDHPELRKILGLDNRKYHLYSLHELKNEKMQDIQKVIDDARKRGDSTQFTKVERKAGELIVRHNTYMKLKRSFDVPKINSEDPRLQLLEFYLIIQQFEKNHPPQIIPQKNSDSEWESWFQAGLKVEIRKLARSVDAKTSRQLAESLVQNLKKDLVVSAVRRFIEVTDELKALKLKNLTPQQMTNVINRQLGSTVYVDILKHMVAPTPTDDPEVIASRIPIELAENLRSFEMFRIEQAFRQRVSKKQLEKILTLNNSEKLDFHQKNFASILEYVIKEILNGETLAEDDYQATVFFQKIIDTYRDDDADAFAEAVTEYKNYLAEFHAEQYSAAALKKELFLNRASPFLANMSVYILAALLAGLGLFVSGKPLQKFAFWLMITTVIYHTAALYLRIEVSGRPPVTNLYSSAVFIGWGCVILGLILELVFKAGVGNLVAAIAGGSTLLIAHFLAADGDTLGVQQAVLDTNFWLATHVICISLGYSTTGLAGILGGVFILTGILTPALNEKLEQTLGKITYGTLCFAIFFSFVGTVLGGLWGDDSWGRFWGWDPKENGALMIVLWNALILHLRWDKSIKARGLAVFTTAGLVVLAWSWFGGNQLGVGLHSYGVQEAAVEKLKMFWSVIAILVLIGCMPKSIWWSYVARERAEAKTQSAIKGKSRRS